MQRDEYAAELSDQITDIKKLINAIPIEQRSSVEGSTESLIRNLKALQKCLHMRVPTRFLRSWQHS